jgi:hypothetical protein
MRRPGFEPGLPDWQSDVLDQTGRPSRTSSDEKNIAYFNCFFKSFSVFCNSVISVILNIEFESLH